MIYYYNYIYLLYYQNFEEKQLININVKLVDVYDETYIAVTQKGEVFSWGVNEFGALGHGQKYSTFSIPEQIVAFSKIAVEMVSCGKDFR